MSKVVAIAKIGNSCRERHKHILMIEEQKFKMSIRKTCLIRLLLLIKHFYFSGMWFGVSPITDTREKKPSCV